LALQKATDDAIAALPKVKLEADPAAINKSITDIGAAIGNLQNKRIEIQSNADQIAKQLADIAKTQYQTELKVRVTYVDAQGKPTTPPSPTVVGLNTGGYVGDALTRMVTRVNSSGGSGGAIQRFASGGFVGRVPGRGNRDSEFRFLDPGSFVLRKSVSESLQKYAGGGGGSGSGSASDLAEKVRSTDVFAREGVLRQLLNRALQFDLDTLQKFASIGGTAVDPSAVYNTREYANKRNESLLLGYRNAVGARDKSRAEGFSAQAIEAFESAKSAFEKTNVTRRFAAGGAAVGDGKVPSLLTPGEIVFSPDQVKKIGLDALYALNQGGFRDRMRGIEGFALGGYVGSVPNLNHRIMDTVSAANQRYADGGEVSQMVGNSSTTNNYTININSADNTDARRMARALNEEIEAINRRRR